MLAACAMNDDRQRSFMIHPPLTPASPYGRDCFRGSRQEGDTTAPGLMKPQSGAREPPPPKGDRAA